MCARRKWRACHTGSGGFPALFHNSSRTISMIYPHLPWIALYHSYTGQQNKQKLPTAHSYSFAGWMQCLQPAAQVCFRDITSSLMCQTQPNLCSSHQRCYICNGDATVSNAKHTVSLYVWIRWCMLLIEEVQFIYVLNFKDRFLNYKALISRPTCNVMTFLWDI